MAYDACRQVLSHAPVEVVRPNEIGTYWKQTADLGIEDGLQFSATRFSARPTVDGQMQLKRPITWIRVSDRGFYELEGHAFYLLSNSEAYNNGLGRSRIFTALSQVLSRLPCIEWEQNE